MMGHYSPSKHMLSQAYGLRAIQTFHLEATANKIRRGRGGDCVRGNRPSFLAFRQYAVVETSIFDSFIAKRAAKSSTATLKTSKFMS